MLASVIVLVVILRSALITTFTFYKILSAIIIFHSSMVRIRAVIIAAARESIVVLRGANLYMVGSVSEHAGQLRKADKDAIDQPSRLVGRIVEFTIIHVDPDAFDNLIFTAERTKVCALCRKCKRARQSRAGLCASCRRQAEPGNVWCTLCAHCKKCCARCGDTVAHCWSD